MKVLWLCNIMLPVIARQLNQSASNKEGWLSGIADTVLANQEKNGIRLAVAFPIEGKELQVGKVGSLTYYGFPEDVGRAERYDKKLEYFFREIIRSENPDIVHCFGTEYPHTLAMCRVFPDKRRILVGLQGLCTLLAEAYYADLPQQVVRSSTFRDLVKRDTLKQQQGKFVLRGRMEREAIALTGNVTGRTLWDKENTAQWNGGACYHHMNESLRKDFYGPVWDREKCIPHSIFLSQGDYPLKGLHYMLLALPEIVARYPDVKVYVAGDNLTAYGTLKQKLKISAYGKYLRRLLAEEGIEDRVVFLGRLDSGQMLAQYLKSSLFVCPSSLENSPNSLGEAMLLGMPCVSAAVGGISSIFTGGMDGIAYEGFRMPKDGEELAAVSRRLAAAVLEMWDNPEKMKQYGENARKHALETHDRDRNYQRLIEIYTEMDRKRPVTVAFVSNYINHHQIPFCNAMNRLTEGNFTFIQTEPMEEERLQMGWNGLDRPEYVRCFYEEEAFCRGLIMNCDMVIFGGTDEESYIVPRLEAGKPILRYSERLYRTGQWKAVSPRGLRKKYHDHIRYRNAPVYLLCAGGYVASDFHIIRAYEGKRFCWGYFPETKIYDVNTLLEGKGYGAEKLPYLLWTARMIDLKHPELALRAAKHLREKGIVFHMDIIGDGELRPQIAEYIEQNDMGDCITLLGYRTPEEVRGYMEKADIFLFTSDRQEGWGAVVNEAMNSGCALVADHMIGAVPFLIQNGENGLVYRDGDVGQFLELTERLAGDRMLCRQMGEKAYRTIAETWNAEKASERLMELIGAILRHSDGEGVLMTVAKDAGEQTTFASYTPCAPAPVLKEKCEKKF